jgi:hypothetical protein
MNSRLLIACLAVALCAGGCATRPKTYTPPSAAKMNASSERLNRAVVKAHETANKARKQVVNTAQAADRMAQHSSTVRAKLAELAKKVPVELKAEVAAIGAEAESEHTEETNVVTGLRDTQVTQSILEKDLGELVASRDQLKGDQVQYVADAGKLANSATEERNYRIAAEKQLSLQRWYGRFLKIGIFLVIAIVILFFVLKFTGKLGLVAAKIGLKL